MRCVACRLLTLCNETMLNTAVLNTAVLNTAVLNITVLRRVQNPVLLAPCMNRAALMVH